MKSFAWYFTLVGFLGILMAVARARSERELFLVLATVPAAFLVVRGAEFWRKRKKK